MSYIPDSPPFFLSPTLVHLTSTTPPSSPRSTAVSPIPCQSPPSNAFPSPPMSPSSLSFRQCLSILKQSNHYLAEECPPKLHITKLLLPELLKDSGLNFSAIELPAKDWQSLKETLEELQRIMEAQSTLPPDNYKTLCDQLCKEKLTTFPYLSFDKIYLIRQCLDILMPKSGNFIPFYSLK